MPRNARKTTSTLIWRGIRCRVSHQPDYLSQGWSHLEIEALQPRRAPLPITETGYLSHFCDEDEVAAAGVPAAFFERWLNAEARSKRYAKAKAAFDQYDLFEQPRRRS